MTTQRVDSDETVATVEAEPSVQQPDIYAILGVTSDVTPGLARQIYWLGVERLQEAQQNGDPMAAAALDDLNAALTIVLDDRRRAQYDREHRQTRAMAPVSRFDRARRIRAGTVVALMLLTIGGALLAAWQFTPVAVAGVVTAGLLAVIAAVSWPHRESVGGRSPFTLLGLTEDASQRHVDVAYETIVQELLSRVKYDPGAIRRLELLDQAYLRAVRMLAERAGTAVPLRQRRTARLLHGLGRGALAVFGLVAGLLGSLALIVLRWLGAMLVRILGDTGQRVRTTSARGVRRTAEQLSVLSRHIGREEDEIPTIEIDFDRRLTSGLRNVAQRAVAGAVPPPFAPLPPLPGDADDAVPSTPRPEPEEDLIEAFLVVEAAAGERRVPIVSAPLRIGSSDDCDLALPADLGLAPEHLLVWQRSGALLLHVIDPSGATCLVDDRPMTWATLEHGDSIRIGNARFRVEVRAA
jgi:hypothetical protein